MKRTSSPPFLLGTLGVLSLAAGDAAAVDTSNWKCESCPYTQGTSGSVDLGLRGVSDDSARFGNYTGLNKKGVEPEITGSTRSRGAEGGWGNLDLISTVPDAVSFIGEGGFEGTFAGRLSYEEIPRYFTDTSRTPFLGNGSGVLTLPAAFPSPSPYGTTAAMPLDSTLQPLELGYKRSRLDVGASWIAGQNWVNRLSVQRDVRDGTKASAGSFYSTSSQLAAPVDQVTDQIEISTSYSTRRLQAKLGYLVSLFSNDQPSLTWSNPFMPVVTGATAGQLALAPDNQFHQITASANYEIDPKVRASADFAWGRMTQNAAYVAPTLNTSLPVSASDLPAQSLDGRVDTFNASLRLTATPSDGLRLLAAYMRDVRDNRTPIGDYPAVSTDMFLGTVPRSNEPYGMTQDRIKLEADYRGPDNLKSSGGYEFDARERSYQEVVTTRESTLWARLAGQAAEELSWSAKLAYSDRSASTYGIAQWVDPPQNPLMRKFYMAERKRGGVELRADYVISETVTLGANADYWNEDYGQSAIGLTEARRGSLGLDLSVALAEKTQMHVFAQGERIRSQLAGSQVYAQPDWTGRNNDRADLLGLGIKHTTLEDKLDLGADLTFSRSYSDVTADTGATNPGFPSATTQLDILKVYATYKLKTNLSLTGSWWYERFNSQDWRLDGVQPDTVYNLLAFGEQPPNYRVNVLRLAVRYKF
jgi:MtrB/PioB family decaheme-associated outer membrane protein